MHRNGSHCPYEYKKFNDLMNKERKVIVFETLNGNRRLHYHNISFSKLEEITAEPYRINHPDEVVTLKDEMAGEHITHYTWNSQMEYIPSLHTYTEFGAKLAKEALESKLIHE